MSNLVEYRDLLAIHPSYYLVDAIESMGITQAEFALRLGLSANTISELLNGKCRVSNDIASRLAAMLKTSPELWINLQKAYDLSMLEIKKAKTTGRQTAASKQIDYGYFTENGLLTEADTEEEKANRLCGFLNVSELRLLKKESFLTKFSTAANLTETNKLNAKVWLQIAIHKARDMQLGLYDEKKLKENIQNIRNLVLLKPAKAIPKIKKILAECGIAFTALPYLRNSNIFGATTWIGVDSKTPVLAINDYQKPPNTFWFTLFHELKHVLQRKVTQTFMVYDRSGKEDALLERKAEAFAENVLIPRHRYKTFVEKRDFERKTINRFAKEMAIPEDIVYVRLYRDGLIELADVPEPEPFRIGKIGKIGKIGWTPEIAADLKTNGAL